MKHVFLIIFLSIIGLANGQQIYFQKTYYDYTTSCLGTDIMRIDSTNYLITGFYSYINIPPGEFINRIDKYGNTLDSSILEPRRDSSGQIYEDYLQHYFAEGLGGDYFKALLIADTVEGLRRHISMIKMNKHHDTLFQTELHSKVKPIDSLWPHANRFYIPIEMQATSDGGVLVMAIASGIRQNMSLVTKLDSIGNIAWEYKIKDDSLGGYPMYSGSSLAELPDTSYIAAYTTNEGTWNGSNHIILKRLDKNGIVIKSKSFGSGYENFIPIVRYNSNDLSLYIAYAKEYYGDDSNPPSTNYYKPNLMKMDTGLNIKWNKFYGNSFYDFMGQIKHPLYFSTNLFIDEDGKMTIFGNVYDKISLVNHTSLNFLLKLDSNGDSLWFKAYDFPNISGNALTTYPYSRIVQNDDKGFTILTNILTDSFEYPIVFRVDSMGCPDPTCRVAKVVENEITQKDFSIFPNPATTQITLDLGTQNQKIELVNIFTVAGQKVLILNNVQSNEPIDIQNLKPGIYLLEGVLESGERFVGKFVKE